MKERYYSIDIYKLIAALLIVSVHTVLFWNYEEGTVQWYAAWMLMATPVRDKYWLRIVPIAYSFQYSLAMPRAYSRKNSMLPMPHKDS